MTNFSRVQLQPAYVLHQRPYRDTSAIVEIFSEAYGRRALVAKGLKRPKSKLKGLLQPFQPLLISWVGRSELGTLTDAELYTHSLAMKSKYLPGAFYLNELLLKLLHKDDPHSDIFISYHNTLDEFRQLSGDAGDELLWQACLRNFEIKLLRSIGYGLVLDHDVSSHLPVKADSQYEFILDRGPVLVDQLHTEHNAITVSGQTLLMLSDQSRSLVAAKQNDSQSRQLFKEAKRLLRSVIDHQLGNKSLHSRELFANVATRKENEISQVKEVIVNHEEIVPEIV
jgi:DNA repair protein RecO (recombination protein O)